MRFRSNIRCNIYARSIMYYESKETIEFSLAVCV